MLARLAAFVIRRRRWVLGLAVIFMGLAGTFGGAVAGMLKGGGFDDPHAESTRAQQVLHDQFKQGDSNFVLVATARDGSVDSAASQDAGRALTARLAGEAGVSQAVSYWSLGDPPPLKSSQGHQALVLARITGPDKVVDERAAQLARAYRGGDGALTVAVTGSAPVFHEVGTTIQGDLAKAEAISIPITLVLLVLVFGSVVAASLPLAIGVFSILSTFLVLRGVASLTDVSIYSINLTTALGLGLAIDYSLFMVSRYREELGHGREPHEAVVRTVRTAGRTVLFSALTVAASLAALLVFPLYFLRSFAYAGIAVVITAAFGAVIVLPALLAVLGRNVDRLRVLRRRAVEPGEGFWHRLATAVMHRPLPVALGVVAILLVLGSPFLRASFGLPDDRVLPPHATARAASADLRTNFTSRESSALSVVAATADPTTATAALASYATELSRVPGAARVDTVTGSYAAGAQVAPPGPTSARYAGPEGRGAWLSVVPSVEPESAAGERLVTDVRATPAPFPVAVGGPSAQLVDSKATIVAKLPLAGGIIAVITFVVLFSMFGSLLVPAKTVVLNLLSLTATFGAMVWIFQDGHGSGLLDFTPTGTLNTTMPILMFCIAFGLSMDYEVFLLSRIKEEHDRGADSVSAVAMGLERTGRIVTAAAALLAVVFIAFATSGISFLKLFGVGLALAVVMDATLVRGALVPAFMRLAGDANWWAPGPLRRLYDRIGFSEAEPDDGERVPPAPAGQSPALAVHHGQTGPVLPRPSQP